MSWRWGFVHPQSQEGLCCSGFQQLLSHCEEWSSDAALNAGSSRKPISLGKRRWIKRIYALRCMDFYFPPQLLLTFAWTGVCLEHSWCVLEPLCSQQQNRQRQPQPPKQCQAEIPRVSFTWLHLWMFGLWFQPCALVCCVPLEALFSVIKKWWLHAVTSCARHSLQRAELRDRYVQMDWSHFSLITHQEPACLLCFDSLGVLCRAEEKHCGWFPH